MGYVSPEIGIYSKVLIALEGYLSLLWPSTTTEDHSKVQLYFRIKKGFNEINYHLFFPKYCHILKYSYFSIGCKIRVSTRIRYRNHEKGVSDKLGSYSTTNIIFPMCVLLSISLCAWAAWASGNC